MSGIVEHVAKAVSKVQLFSRYNDFTFDRVEGFPIEICKRGLEEKDEDVVVRRFSADKVESTCLYDVISEERARDAHQGNTGIPQ